MLETGSFTRFIDEQLEATRAAPPHIPFTAEEYAGRLQRLRAAMEETGIDMVLLSSPEAMYWLHGYALRWYKSHAPRAWRPLTCTAVHVDHDRFITFEGAEHEEMLRRTSISSDNRFLPRYQRDRMLDFIVGELRGEGWLTRRVGVELYSYVPNPAVSGQLRAAFEGAGATIVDASEPVRRVRRRKSPAELAYVERAAEICDIAITHLRGLIRPGMTELEAWSEMLHAMAAVGGEPAALHELAVIGNGGIGHSISGRRELRPGDWLHVDPCGVYERYHANRSALYHLGEPPQEAVELMSVLAGAFDVLRGVAKAGTPVAHVNSALREYYVEHGVWDLKANTWIGGYELGASFPPDWVGEWLFTVNDEHAEGVFEEGMVTNFESIIGLALLDTLIYEADGARTLSKVPYEIMAVAG